MIYNVKYSTETLLLVAGDKLNFTINVQECFEQLCLPFDLTGLPLEWVIYNTHGREVTRWSTEAGTIIVNGYELTVNAPALERKSCCYRGHLYIVLPRTTLLMGMVRIT